MSNWIPVIPIFMLFYLVHSYISLALLTRPIYTCTKIHNIRHVAYNIKFLIYVHQFLAYIADMQAFVEKFWLLKPLHKVKRYRLHCAARFWTWIFGPKRCFYDEISLVYPDNKFNGGHIRDFRNSTNVLEQI